MLAVVRVKIRLKETTGKGVVALQTANMDKVWRRVIRNHKKWDGDGARAVYLTHRSLREDVSLILDAKNADSIGNYISKHVAPMKEVAGIRIITFMNPRFFVPSKGTPRGMKRFTIAVSVKPNHLDEVYEYLSNFSPNKGLAPAYLAYTFNGLGRDISFSVFCRGGTTLKKFVDTYLNTHEGILDTKTTYISQSKRLVPREEWKKVIKRMMVKMGDFEMEEFEDFDEDWMASC